MKLYAVNEVFYSLQGEGLRSGVPNVFLRFAGCNQTCSVATHGFDCDTEFASARQLTLDDIVRWVLHEAGTCRSMVLTGGEPSLQLDAAVISAFKHLGFYLAIETNGTRELPAGLDWITVSPKTPEHLLQQRCATEVKYVRSFGQNIPNTVVHAEHYLISPAFGPQGIDVRNLQWCINLVKDNPDWRLSVQQHKLWGIR
jgi:7-carboxy-7-deazaguanine synthase